LRLALELTNFLIRRVQGNSYWKGCLKDGVEILNEKGIITDKIFLNHFKVSNVGTYGFLSVKESHAEGETTNNLADSDLEAKYCMSLTLNAIQYLLMSFKNYKYFNNEQ